MLANGSKLALSRKIARDEWNAAVLADTPPLPWMASGRAIAGFVLAPIPECVTGTTVVFIDSEGEPIEVCNEGPMVEMAHRLHPRLAEVTLLPEDMGG